LPTPRSSTESRVSEALPLHITNNNGLLELQSCIKPEPMLQIRPLHSISPSVDIQVGSSPSGQREDMVEIVKAGLETLQPGAVQEYRGIGTEEFDKLYGLLEEARLRFDFDSDLRTLIIRMASDLHVVVVTSLSKALMDGMERQQMLGNSEDMLLPWRLGTNMQSMLKNGSMSKYVADITVHDRFNKALIVVEVAGSQTRNDVLAKISDRFANNPKLLGAVVISIEESPAYESPERKGTARDAALTSLWMEAVRVSPKWGPINYRGFRWIGSITCTLDVRLRGEDRPRAQQISIVPKSDSGDLEASNALTDLWRLLVKDVAGEGVVPVPLVVNWNMFRLVLAESLGSTAYWRHLEWNGVREVSDDDEDLRAELEGKQGIIM